MPVLLSWEKRFLRFVVVSLEELAELLLSCLAVGTVTNKLEFELRARL